jgi:MFS family permease
MIMPVTLAVITSTFPQEERGRAIGVWTGVAGGGGLLGMFLSSVLVDLANWRYLFVLPVVLVVVAAGTTLRSVPDSRELTTYRFDLVGALTSVVAVVGLIFFLQEAPERGWTSPPALISLLVGVLAAVAFAVWELRQAAPLLDVRLFRERGLAGGSVVLLVVFGVQAGIAVMLYPYFQAVLGWSGLRSTVALLPMAVLMMVMSGVTPRLAQRIGARATMAAGVALAGVGLALMAALVSVDRGYIGVLPGMVAMGLGLGLSMPPATEAITSALPRERQGVASALNDVTREFGTALGVALLGALLSAGYRHAIDPRLDGVPAGTAATAREGLANAIDAAGPGGAGLVRAAQESFVAGWQTSMWVATALLAALLLYVVSLGRTSPGSVVAAAVAQEAGGPQREAGHGQHQDG